eukprot:TCONS_00054475-protein
MKVTILGTGNGGFAMAFHMSKMGHEVLIYQREESKEHLQAVVETGKIIAIEEVDGHASMLHGEVNIAKTTFDIKEAVEFANNLMLVVPAFGQVPIFEKALPYLTANHVLVCLPGNFATLEFVQRVQKKFPRADSPDNDHLHMTKIPVPFAVVEASTLPYTCRKVGGNKIFIAGSKDCIKFGVFPSTRTDIVLDRIQPLFELKIWRAKDILEAALSNLNMVIHPGNLIYNAGWIEATKGNFYFYNVGMTEAIENMIKAIDKERREVCKAFGYKDEDYLQIACRWYTDHKAKTLREFVANRGPLYHAIKAPNSLRNRYITEDLNYVLVPIMRFLAKVAGVQTPVSNATITAAEVLCGIECVPARNFDILLKDIRSLEDVKQRL